MRISTIRTGLRARIPANTGVVVIVIALAAVVLGQSGCMRAGTTLDSSRIERLPYSRWTEEDCYLYLKEIIATNVWNPKAGFRVFAVPCTPSVIFAVNRRHWLRHEYTEEQFNESIERQAARCLGAGFDTRSFRFAGKGSSDMRTLLGADSVVVSLGIEPVTSLHDLEGNLDLLKSLGIQLSQVPSLFPTVNMLRERVWLDAGDGLRVYSITSDALRDSLLTHAVQTTMTFPLSQTLNARAHSSDGVQLHVMLAGEDVILRLRLLL